MTRAEFIDYFDAVWYDNFGLPHNAEEFDKTWEVCLNALAESGEQVDYNWCATAAERAKYIYE